MLTKTESRSLFPAATAGSLPKPAWLAEPNKLWPQWRLKGEELAAAIDDATLVAVKLQEDAGAGFLKPFGLFQDNDAKAVARQRQCRRQPADAGACDNDDARRCEDVGSVADSSGVAPGALRRPRFVGSK